MNKSIKNLSLAILAFFTIQVAMAHGPWKEMETFHSIMGKTFHPAEKDNLQPVKENSADLLAKAKVWQAAVVPEGYDAELSKKILVTLVAKCAELNKAVKAKKSDADLKKLITEAHDIFHEIAEKCHKH